MDAETIYGFVLILIFISIAVALLCCCISTYKARKGVRASFNSRSGDCGKFTNNECARGDEGNSGFAMTEATRVLLNLNESLNFSSIDGFITVGED